MTKAQRHFWVGSAVILLIAVLIIMLCTVFTPNFFRPKTTVETYFKESINGLSVGSAVSFQGVKIGEVDEILLSSSAYPQNHINLFSDKNSVAVVQMTVYLDKNKLAEQLPKMIEDGLRIQTQLSGITGTLFLSAGYQDPRLYPPEVTEFPWKPAHLYIPSAISLTNEILDNLEQFFSTLQSVKKDMNIGTSRNGLADLRLSLVRLNEIVEGVSPESIKTLLNSAEDWIKTSSETLDEVDVKKINSLLTHLSSAAKEISEATGNRQSQSLVKQLSDTTADFNRMVAQNNYDIRALIVSLVSITQNLSQVTQQWASIPVSSSQEENPFTESP